MHLSRLYQESIAFIVPCLLPLLFPAFLGFCFLFVGSPLYCLARLACALFALLYLFLFLAAFFAFSLASIAFVIYKYSTFASGCGRAHRSASNPTSPGPTPAIATITVLSAFTDGRHGASVPTSQSAVALAAGIPTTPRARPGGRASGRTPPASKATPTKAGTARSTGAIPTRGRRTSRCGTHAEKGEAHDSATGQKAV